MIKFLIALAILGHCWTYKKECDERRSWVINNGHYYVHPKRYK